MLSQLSVYSLEKLAILFFLLSRSLTITFIYLFLFFFLFLSLRLQNHFCSGEKIDYYVFLCFVPLFCIFFFFYIAFFFLSLFPHPFFHVYVYEFYIACTCILRTLYVYYAADPPCDRVCVCEYIDICSRARMPTVYTDFKQLVFTRFFNQHFYNFLYFCSLIIVSHSVRRSVQLLLMLINVIYFFFLMRARWLLA